MAWKTYQKWREVLEFKQATFEIRTAFWKKTVLPSLTWGLETTRSSKKSIRVVRRAQHHIFTRMLGRKRRPMGQDLEPWTDFFIRVPREVKQIVRKNKIDIQQVLAAKTKSFAGHVSRFAPGDRETHLVKMIILWRCNHWWSFQKKQI